jgi:hypothetical protein
MSLLLLFLTANKYFGGGRVRAGEKKGRVISVGLLFATSLQCSLSAESIFIEILKVLI